MARARKTAAQFASEMALSSPSVELVGEYRDARTKVACRCRVCGFVWEASPNHLLRGAGCPACAGTLRLDAAEFAGRVSRSSPTVELVDAYVNARTRLACRCAVCGNEWSTLPKNLLAGHGCPACAEREAVARLHRGRDVPRTADDGVPRTAGDDGPHPLQDGGAR